MVKGEYEIFTCTKEEVKIVTDMAVAEGWTESYDAIDAIYNLDPEGYFVGKIDGKIVSSISAVRYPGNYGFIGFYIVLEEYRGKGYGIKIFKHAMEHLKGCLVCLDAVAQEVETYKRGGFVSSEGTDRYVGTSKILPVDSHIHAYDENSHFEEVAAYDEGCLPSQRKDFLREWLKIPHAKSVVYLDDNNRLQGYGSIHRTCHGWEIAPCYSENKEIAKCIMTALINQIGEGEKFGINTPDNHPAAVELVQEITGTYNIYKKFSNKRMYACGLPTNLQTYKFFSLLSLTVG